MNFPIYEDVDIKYGYSQLNKNLFILYNQIKTSGDNVVRWVLDNDLEVLSIHWVTSLADTQYARSHVNINGWMIYYGHYLNNTGKNQSYFDDYNFRNCLFTPGTIFDFLVENSLCTILVREIEQKSEINIEMERKCCGFLEWIKGECIHGDY